MVTSCVGEEVRVDLICRLEAALEQLKDTDSTQIIEYVVSTSPRRKAYDVEFVRGGRFSKESYSISLIEYSPESDFEIRDTRS